ncbi:TPA: acyltransferase [Citrobacter farmeri]|uniref:acyltransferase n=1 Tax=Citrobacter farmeri TaxID=67824 RepID=UPI001E3F2DE8|nr:acyltransferase [Citrobacter farmeri]GJL45477.1 transferase [Citrobacter farmeri]HEM7973297.1 acyltransferase [Citrobacter farmeri]HEM7987003.1 acyltransferase [Citrobacter farmeri]
MKKIISTCIKYIFSPVGFLLYFLYKVNVINYKTSTQLLAFFPGIIGLLIRQFYYELSLTSCGKNLRVFWGAYIVYPDVIIGNNCTIEEFCILSKCKLGDDVILAARVSIMSGSKHHDINDLTTTFGESKSEYRTVQLGNNLWIGTHAVIMNDIGDNTAIGAGAVVSRAIPEMVVAAGVPARIIKHRGKS